MHYLKHKLSQFVFTNPYLVIETFQVIFITKTVFFLSLYFVLALRENQTYNLQSVEYQY